MELNFDFLSFSILYVDSLLDLLYLPISLLFSYDVECFMILFVFYYDFPSFFGFEGECGC